MTGLVRQTTTVSATGVAAWVDGREAVPLSEAQLLSDDDLAVAAAWLGQVENYAGPVRLAVGAALVHRRSGFRRGEWMTFVSAFAQQVGVKPGALGRWMRAAEEHYELDPPKGANPGRRETRPEPSISDPKPAAAAPPAVASPPAPSPASAAVETGREPPAVALSDLPLSCADEDRCGVCGEITPDVSGGWCAECWEASEQAKPAAKPLRPVPDLTPEERRAAEDLDQWRADTVAVCQAVAAIGSRLMVAGRPEQIAAHWQHAEAEQVNRVMRWVATPDGLRRVEA